jgi:hypothetical protein
VILDAAFLATEIRTWCPRAHLSLTDGRYYLPRESWLLADGGKAIRERYELDGLSGYQPEIADCDDYAIKALDAVRDAHREFARQAKIAKRDFLAAGLAFGYCAYTRTDGRRHALNLAVTRRGAHPAVIFWEPQTQELATLTLKEAATCSLVLI